MDPTLQNMELPRYLRSPYDFSGGTVPGFYNINVRNFPFWRMRNQFSGNEGIYTPGRPMFSAFNQDNPTAQAGVMLPNGRSLYGITQNPNGWPNDPLSQELLARSYNPGGGGSGMQINPEEYNRPRAYNRAMRRYARQEAGAGRPLMAYYDPRFSAPRPRMAQPVPGLLV